MTLKGDAVRACLLCVLTVSCSRRSLASRSLHRLCSLDRPTLFLHLQLGLCLTATPQALGLQQLAASEAYRAQGSMCFALGCASQFDRWAHQTHTPQKPTAAAAKMYSTQSPPPSSVLPWAWRDRAMPRSSVPCTACEVSEQDQATRVASTIRQEGDAGVQRALHSKVWVQCACCTQSHACWHCHCSAGHTCCCSRVYYHRSRGQLQTAHLQHVEVIKRCTAAGEREGRRDALQQGTYTLECLAVALLAQQGAHALDDLLCPGAVQASCAAPNIHLQECLLGLRV